MADNISLLPPTPSQNVTQPQAVQGTGSQSAFVSPRLPAGTVLQGFIVNRDASGNPVLRTETGDVTFSTPFFLKIGSEVVLRVDNQAGAQQAHVLSVNGQPPEVAEAQSGFDQGGEVIVTNTQSPQQAQTTTRAQAPASTVEILQGAEISGTLISASEGQEALPAGTQLAFKIVSLATAPEEIISNATAAATATPATTNPAFYAAYQRAPGGTLAAPPAAAAVVAQASAGAATPAAAATTAPAATTATVAPVVTATVAAPSITPAPVAAAAPVVAAAAPTTTVATPTVQAVVAQVPAPAATPVITATAPVVTQTAPATPTPVATAAPQVQTVVVAQTPPAETTPAPVATQAAATPAVQAAAAPAQPVVQAAIPPVVAVQTPTPQTPALQEAIATIVATPPAQATITITPAKTPVAQPPIQTGQTVSAVVLGQEPTGETLLQTGGGIVRLQQGVSLPQGSVVQVEVGDIILPVPLEVAAVNPGPPAPLSVLAREWTSIQQIMSLLQTGPLQAGAPAPQVPPLLQAYTPHTLPLPQNISAGLMLFVAAIGAGDFSAWLGKSNVQWLQDQGYDNLVKKADAEFGIIARQFADVQPHQWQPLFFPVAVDGQWQQVRLFIKRDRQKKGEQKAKAEDTRFVVEMDLSQMGEMQMDGFVRQSDKQINFDLFIRSLTPLSDKIQQDIYTIYNSTGELTGYKGTLLFQSVKEFPVNPMEEIMAKAHESVMV